MSCPICGKAPEEKYRPFCSRRCADVDLGRWLTGSYAIAAEPVEEVDLADREAEEGLDADGSHKRPN
jgi:endogenous inhibitor of DNA gyrase (YacG/DUF329 family)